jgi:hypothetical protein
LAIVNGYATLPEAKGWIGLTDNLDDSRIENIVTTVSRWIDNYCRRQFWATTAGTARVFDSDDGQCVDLTDVTTVTAVKTDENQDGTFETTWAAADYQLLPLNVASPEAKPYRSLHSTGNRVFPCPYYPGRIGLVQVTGTWGWPAIPEPVSQACQMQVSRILQRRKSPEGVSGWGEFGPMRISGRLDPDVAQLLTGYRLSLVA